MENLDIKRNIIPAKAEIMNIGKVCILYLLLFIPNLLAAQGYKIETVVSNSKDTIAYLGHHFATQRYLDDTVKVVDGKAIFEGSNTLIEGIYFYYTPTNYFEFLVEDQHFTLETTAPDFTNSMKIKDSKINEGFYRLQQFTGEMKQTNKLLREEYDSARNEAEKERIKEALTQLNTEVADFQNELKEEYAGTFFARLITLMQSPKVPETPDGIENTQLFRYEYYKNNFWKGIDIADPGLLRTPLLDAKIKDYLDNVIIQQSDSVIKEVDWLVSQTKKSKESFRFLLITLVNKYESSTNMDFDKVFVHIIETYYLTGMADEWTNKETLDKLRKRVDMIKPNFIGNDAPQLALWDTLGTLVDLRSIDADYTVLYFYAPDCGHCKKKTPVLYEAYPELAAKGVEILAICTTTDEKEWKDFIKKHDLGWINLADLESKTYVKYYYDIRSTPTVYILDKDKKILLKKIDALDIPDVIDQLIKQKEKK